LAETILLTTASPARRQGIEEYRAEGGYEALVRARSEGNPAGIVDAVEAAGLRGRGGAAFPTARKWRLALQAEGTPRSVVANGGEHEPGSRKDRHLVEFYPHKVLEGLLIAAVATRATQGYLYLIEDMEGPLASAEAARDELREAGLLGDFELKIHRAPTTYVAGEETAAIDSIEGGPGKPREKPPYPGESGLFGGPTTVNNVETLAHVPWILTRGADAYRALGTRESPGTMLFTLDEAVERPGVYERPFGTTYRELIDECGGGPRGGRAIRAVLPALSCGFLGAEHLDLPIAHETLRPLGSSPGCGGVHLILEGDDVVQKVRDVARFFEAEQCGQCPPCRMETGQFSLILKGVQDGKKGDFAGQLEKIAGFTRGKGLCSLIEMAAAPVLSAARLFRREFEARARE